MTLLRRLLLALCALGVVGGLGLVAHALVPPTSPHVAASAAAQPMLAVAAATASVNGFSASAGPFEIDALEVSVAEYAACVRAGACPLQVTAASVHGDSDTLRGETTGCSGGRADLLQAPINCVDYAAALAYCKWAGKRLPTREEWWIAFAPQHEKRIRELHRPEPSRRGFRAEWTASVVSAPDERGAVELLRHTGAWSTNEEDKNWYGVPYSRRFAVSTRSPSISFRCAR